MLSKLKSLSYWGYALGLLIAIQPSYIHPDEHFQTLEILAQKFGGIKGTIPWEFQNECPARSFVPLYLFYGPLYFILFKILHIQNPNIILSSVRLQNYLLYVIMVKWFLKQFCEPKTIKSINFLISTSYITSAVQSHSFSNSIETLILLSVLACYKILMSSSSAKNSDAGQNSANKNNYLINIFVAILIVIGIFNRMTFPAFILLPSLTLFSTYYIHHLKSFLLFIITGFATFLLCVQFDTWIFNSNQYDTSYNYIIAPWNNLKYNLQVSNLKLHGLHPRYTHILINIPQILGPGLFLVYITIKGQKFNTLNKYNLPFLSIISALIILSIFPHQELRFLIPLTPLIFITFNNIPSKKWIPIWLLYNIIMNILMGCFHQSGIIKMISHHQQKNTDFGIHIWWKTYMPPTWMYMNPNLTVSTTEFINDTTETIDFDEITSINQNYVIDLKGCDLNLLNSTISQLLTKNENLTLIVSDSMKTKLFTLKPYYDITEDFHTYTHLDLDHFDFNDMSTFVLGLTSYNVSNIKEEENKNEES